MLRHHHSLAPAIFLFAGFAALSAPSSGCAGPTAAAPEAYVFVNGGASSLEAGSLDDAEASYRLALEYDNHIAEAHVGLAVVAMRRGDAASAEVHLESALAIDEDMVEAHNVLGTLRADRGNLDGAVAAFRAALSIDPGQRDARYNLAVIHASAGRFERSRAHLLRLVQYEESADVQALLAYCELRLDRPAAALRRAHEALRLDDRHPRAFLVGGIVLMRDGDAEGALRAFGVALAAAEERANDDDESSFQRAVYRSLAMAARVGVLESALSSGELGEARAQLDALDRSGAPAPLLARMREHYRRAMRDRRTAQAR